MTTTNTRRTCLARALLAAALAGSCGGEQPAPASVLLITLDTTRADVLGCYGDERGLTPNLDAFARESLVLDRAYTVAPITLPSHASLLTGLYPPRHSVRDNGYWPLPDAAQTLAETALEGGFQTGAIVASVVLDDVFGLAQGFETYDGSEVAQSSVFYQSRPAREITDRALRWLEARDRTRPFFLWLHYYDPHAPYAPPPEFREGREGAELYFGEIAAVDHELGRLFARLRATGVMDTTLVAVASDHGEAFGEHGEITHGPYCYDTTLRIPVLMRHPDGYRAGERDDGLVSLVDLHPTLLEAMGFTPPGGVDGESFFRRSAPRDRGLYFESYMGFLSFGWSPLAGWLDEDGKYLHSSEPEFYALADDPSEARNIVERDALDVERYRSAIGRVADAPALSPSLVQAIDEDLRQELRSLGYASLGATPVDVPHPLEPSDRPSPAQRMLEYSSLLRAVGYLDARLYGEAIAILEQAVRNSPQNYFALEHLCSALVASNRMEEALPHLLRLTRDGPARSVNFQNLASCLAGLGRNEESIEALQRAIALDPKNVAALEGLIKMLMREGRASEVDSLRRRLRELQR